MSTRSTTHFISNGKTEAIIYRHSDGYPEGHGVDLQEHFFADVEAQTKDTRYGDPTYLAAKLVVWLADKFATRYDFTGMKPEEIKTEPLDFLSVGVCMEDPGDIEFLYEVHCDSPVPPHGRPAVKCFERGEGGWDGPFPKGREVSIPASTEVEAG